jgi:hypothetical protein
VHAAVRVPFATDHRIDFRLALEAASRLHDDLGIDVVIAVEPSNQPSARMSEPARDRNALAMVLLVSQHFHTRIVESAREIRCPIGAAVADHHELAGMFKTIKRPQYRSYALPNKRGAIVHEE